MTGLCELNTTRGNVQFRKGYKRHSDATDLGASRTRFRIRFTVEPSNEHLKDWLLPDKAMVRGHSIVSFCLLSGVSSPVAVKIRRHIILPGLQWPSAA